MADEEVIKLILQTAGKETVDALVLSTDALKAALEKLVIEHKNGTISAKEFEKAQRQLGSEYQRQMELLGDLDPSLKKSTKSTMDLGYAGLTAGRALQDFTQGGIGGILNNIEGMVSALGGGGGLAGLLTAVGVAAFIAKPHLAALWEAITGPAADARTVVEKLEDRIKQLQEMKVKFAVDRLELDAAEAQLKRMKDGLAEFQRMQTGQSENEAEAGHAVQDVLANRTPGGEKAVSTVMASQILKEMESTNQKLIDARKEQAAAEESLKKMQANPFTPASVIVDAEARLKTSREVTTGIEDEAKSAAGDIVRGAVKGSGPEQANKRQQLVERMKRAGLFDQAMDVARSTPEAAAQAKQAEIDEAAAKERDSAEETIRKNQERAEKEERDKEARAALAGVKDELDYADAVAASSRAASRKLEFKVRNTRQMGNELFANSRKVPAKRRDNADDQFNSTMKQAMEASTEALKAEHEGNTMLRDELLRVSQTLIAEAAKARRESVRQQGFINANLGGPGN